MRKTQKKMKTHKREFLEHIEVSYREESQGSLSNRVTIFEKKAGTESSNHLTGVKTILSVRAHKQHLFVLDKMILMLIKILFSKKHLYDVPPRAL